jgi:GMP reductase
MVCIDVANGYMTSFVDFCKKFRAKHPNLIIMAGNVVTGDGTQELLLNGVDIAKVGIGPGSVCTTRKMTGVGRPQFSAIVECAEAADAVGGMTCGDGGCTVPGDFGKAFGGGADFVMAGGVFAGHIESELPMENGKFKFYGMSSEEAMNNHSGGMTKYRAAEGKVVYLDNRGSIEKTLLEILGGIRSTCSYIGAKTLKDLPEKAVFYQVNNQLNEVFGKS